MSDQIKLLIGHGEVPDITAPEDEVYEGQKVLLMAVFDIVNNIGINAADYENPNKITYKWYIKNGGTEYNYGGHDKVVVTDGEVQVIKVWDTAGIRPGIYTAWIEVVIKELSGKK